MLLDEGMSESDQTLLMGPMWNKQQPVHGAQEGTHQREKRQPTSPKKDELFAFTIVTTCRLSPAAAETARDLLCKPDPLMLLPRILTLRSPPWLCVWPNTLSTSHW